MNRQRTKKVQRLLGAVCLAGIALTGCESVSLNQNKLEAARNFVPIRAGYLCCNLYTDGFWVSDINYRDTDKQLLAAGTPVSLTAYGRQRVGFTVEGQSAGQYLGNDYSRDLTQQAFARRYIVSEDPRPEIATYPVMIQAAIKSAKVMRGMTEDQVIMALGWPVTSENPDRSADLWRYWLSSSREFQIVFDQQRRVDSIRADKQTAQTVIYR
ncbi:MAG: hypothetical protein ACRBC3_13145 [Burkholderiaceae bacterium]